MNQRFFVINASASCVALAPLLFYGLNCMLHVCCR